MLHTCYLPVKHETVDVSGLAGFATCTPALQEVSTDTCKQHTVWSIMRRSVKVSDSSTVLHKVQQLPLLAFQCKSSSDILRLTAPDVCSGHVLHAAAITPVQMYNACLQLLTTTRVACDTDDDGDDDDDDRNGGTYPA